MALRLLGDRHGLQEIQEKEEMMAGIRGAQNPVPVKPPTAKGIFKQRGPGPVKNDMDTKAAAMKSDRMGPPASRNSGTAPGRSHYVNDGLKKGTAK